MMTPHLHLFGASAILTLVLAACSAPAAVPQQEESSVSPRWQHDQTSGCITVRAWFGCQRIGEDGTWVPVKACNGASMLPGDQVRWAYEVDSPAFVYALDVHRNMDGVQVLAARLVHGSHGDEGHAAPGTLVVYPKDGWMTLDEVGMVQQQFMLVVSRGPVEALDALGDQSLQADLAQRLLDELATAEMGQVICPLPTVSSDQLMVPSAFGDHPLSAATVDGQGPIGIGLRLERP